jgi:pyruvyltransferase
MKQVCLYYFYSYSFGDAFSSEIVARIVGSNDFQSVNGFSNDRNQQRGFFSSVFKYSSKPHKRLLALGSIFHNVRDGDVIWGTGVNPKWQSLSAPCEQPDIRAVRGPLTRQFLQRRYGWECPEVYGDPAILFPELFPEFKLNPTRDYTIILQHNDEEYVRDIKKFDKYNVFYCQRPERRPWRAVIDNILSSRLVVSSSLHAIIIAEMYGIPTRWLSNPELPSSETEATFKFNDYYMSSGRDAYPFSLTVDQALKHGGTKPPTGLNKKKLLNAFPRELF